MAGERLDNNRCAVDVRLFLLSIVFAMSVAFFAGVWVVPPPAVFTAFSSAMKRTRRAVTVDSSPTPRHLELSKATDFYTSQEHSPSGQHVLVDIEGVDGAFLDSEERLSDAMVKTVQEAGLTMLSYHCHKLDPMGVSCVGVLMESHISFHTWPEEGVITLDLFTCGANPLLPVVPVIERLFGIGEKSRAKWAHELRGFRSMEEKKANYLDNFSDLSGWVLSPIEIHSKKQIYSNLTTYQRVDIWELSEPENQPTFEDGIKHNLPDGDPRWLDLDYYTPDRILFLDGIIQSMYSHEREYHEALVHPAMFAHPDPVHVGIIGGGEGATLREVLKHNTIKGVTMIEIDAELIEIARQFLPKMSDCGDLIGRADNCFDDEIVDVVNDNGIKWFVDRYGSSPTVAPPPEKFSVVIIDALDPEDENPFSTDLYVDSEFVSAIMDSLADNGVLMIQIGTAPELLDPKADIGKYAIREKLFTEFDGHADVAAMHVYEEPNSGFMEPHSFLVVCKSASCHNLWYARSDFIDYEIYDRIVHTKSGQRGLNYYDGTTQYSYQVPPKAWETVYCRREPTPFECAYRTLDLDKEIHEYYLDDEDKSSFKIELHKNDDGEVVSSSVFAKVDIPRGSFIMPEHMARSLVVSEQSLDGLKGNTQVGGGKVTVIEDLLEFVDENGHRSHTEGTDLRFVEIGGSVMIRDVDTEEKANVGRWVPPHPTGRRPPLSPVYDRHRMSFEVFLVATKNIPEGAELTRYEMDWSKDLK